MPQPAALQCEGLGAIRRGQEGHQLERKGEVGAGRREVTRQDLGEKGLQLRPAKVQHQRHQRARRVQLGVRAPCIQHGASAAAAALLAEPAPERGTGATLGELVCEPAEEARAPQCHIRVRAAQPAAQRQERELALGGFLGAERREQLAVRKDELVPSNDGHEAAARAMDAVRLLPAQLLRAARQVQRLPPAHAELLPAAKGDELHDARRLGNGLRRWYGAGGLETLSGGGGAAAGDRRRVRRLLQLLQQVHDDVRVAGDDQHLHVLVHVQASLAQLGQQQVPVVELGDGRVIFLEGVEITIASAEILKQPRHSHAILKLIAGLLVEHVEVERRRREVRLIDGAVLEQPFSERGRKIQACATHQAQRRFGPPTARHGRVVEG